MVKIKDPEDITIRQISKKVYELASIYGGYYRHKIYMGYTKAQATKDFKDKIKRGEL